MPAGPFAPFHDLPDDSARKIITLQSAAPWPNGVRFSEACDFLQTIALTGARKPPPPPITRPDQTAQLNIRRAMSCPFARTVHCVFVRSKRRRWGGHEDFSMGGLPLPCRVQPGALFRGQFEVDCGQALVELGHRGRADQRDHGEVPADQPGQHHLVE